MKRIQFLFTAICTACVTGFTTLAAAPTAQADTGSSSGLEFRWDNSDQDYRKLYYHISSARASNRSDYHLVLGPKDRKTAMLKLAISVPKDFDAYIDPKNVELCYMLRGGVTRKTECQKMIPSVVEVNKEGTAIEIFPNEPVPVGRSIGVRIQLNNPYNPGMYQFNALAQAPGDVPISGYLGSWVIEISP
ncbi:MAG: DUF2808 domain-containing protein [Synechococcaceae bacterium WBB_3_034]|jgi:hypothetical protein|nr:DUF2808 domain-containing protein [Synechococcaceae bacterium WBB_3_034]NDG23315.1 DUF2808 domain-containing protein [Synechococcaceae bacterium WBB_10_009]